MYRHKVTKDEKLFSHMLELILVQGERPCHSQRQMVVHSTNRLTCTEFRQPGTRLDLLTSLGTNLIAVESLSRFESSIISSQQINQLRTDISRHRLNSWFMYISERYFLSKCKLC
eukprot:745808-Hanusia_phi.AAC.2